jgi:hypothetical protein
MPGFNMSSLSITEMEINPSKTHHCTEATLRGVVITVTGEGNKRASHRDVLHIIVTVYWKHTTWKNRNFIP